MSNRAVILVRRPPRVVALVKADIRNPGSRGGQFHRTKTGKVAYGKTSSGKVIGHPEKTVAAGKGILGSTSHVAMHRAHPGWTPDDHREATAHHDAQAKTHGIHTKLGGQHSNAALAHTIAANFPAASPAVGEGQRAALASLRSSGFKGDVRHDVTPVTGKQRLSARNGDLHVGLVAEKDGKWSVLWTDAKGTDGTLHFASASEAGKAMARILKGDG